MTDAAPDFAIWREGSGDAPFLVCAFFTKSYLAKAQRLAASLDRLNLPYAIFESPAVHRSISRHGGADLRYCKARFIAFCLAHAGRAVLYVDADVVFRESPIAVFQAAQGGADFAAFNWLAAPLNDTWMPPRNLPQPATPRFWAFGFVVDKQSANQLATSGAVQFWRSTAAARVLLGNWEAAIARFSRAPDDHALDFAFNLGNARGAGLRAFWLPPDHARYAHWPYVKPVIDHPDFPAAPGEDGFEDINERFNPALIKIERRPPVFPRDLVLDAHRGLMLRPLAPDRLEPVAPIPYPLFLDDMVM